jgi:hypothetical protein
MNPTDLAKSVIYWLEFERLCGRDHLFSEESLKQPIGQYLISNLSQRIEPEHNYPDQYQPNGPGRRRSMDFAVLRSGDNETLLHAVESKFINSKREFKQEMFDDVFRLAWFDTVAGAEPCNRWMIVAGRWTNIRTKLFNATTRLRPRGRMSETFRGVLPKKLTSPLRHVQVHSAAPGIRKLWVDAATAFGQSQIPNAIEIRLSARFPATPHPTGFCCLIWSVTRSAGFHPYPN